MREYTPEELGLTPPAAQKEYTPEELGLAPAQKEYTPEELGLIPATPAPGSSVTVSAAPTEITETTNPFKGAAARGSVLLGQGIEGVARVAESAGDYLEKKLPLSGLSKEEIEGKRQLEPLFKWADSLKNFGQEINYKPTQKLSDIGENPLTLVPFIAERVVTSSPDMAAAVAAMPAYIVARTNEILNDRIKNDDKQLKDVTVGDVAVSAGAAILEATLERFATKGLLKGQHVTGATGATRIGKETVFQAGTEGIEEGIGYLGGTAGTKKGVDPSELAQNVIEGAIVGGGLGATVQGGKEAYGKVTGKTPTMGEVPAPPAPVPTTTPAVESEGAKQKFFEEAQTRYQELGLSRKDAERLANEEAKESGYGDRTVAGAPEPSIQAPSVGAAPQGPTAGVTGAEPGQLGGTSGTTGVAGVGAETQRGALEPADVKNKANTEALNTFNVPKTENADGTVTYGTPTPAVQKQVDAYSLGAYDAAQGFEGAKYAEGFKGKEKKAYEDGFDFGQKLVGPKEAAAPEENVPPPAEPTGAPLPAPTVTKGKAGRPKAVLTPEQAAAKAEARKVSQAGTRDAIRLAEKSQKVLDTPAPDPLDFESLDAAEVAQSEYLQTRRQALEDAYTLSVAPAHRNNKAGTLAKAMLEKATPQERELAKNRYEMKQKLNAPSRAEIAESTNGEDNAKYESFNNAKSALNWIAKNGNEFEKVLAKRLAPYLNGVKLVLVNSHLDLPSKSLQNSMDGAVGLYVPGRNTIYLMRNGGTNNTVFLHEALHGATVKRINAYLQAKLEGRAIPNDLRVAVAELMETMDEARQLYDTLRAQGVLSDAMLAIPYDAFTDIKEFVSYGLTLPAMQDFLLLPPGEYAGEAPGFISKLFSKFVQSLRKMFDMGENHTSALQDLIIITDKLLRTKEQETVSPDTEANAAKKQSKKEAKVDKDLEKIRLSNNAFDTTGSIGDIIREGHSFEDIKVLLNAKFPAMENAFIKKLLYGLQTVDILRWKGDEIPGLNEVDELQQEMAAMRTHMLNASAKKGDRLGAFIRKNGMKTLGDTMHLARLKKVSPTKAPDAAAYIAQDPVIQNYNKLIADPNTTPEQKNAYKGKITTRTNDINAV